MTTTATWQSIAPIDRRAAIELAAPTQPEPGEAAERGVAAETRRLKWFSLAASLLLHLSLLLILAAWLMLRPPAPEAAAIQTVLGTDDGLDQTFDAVEMESLDAAGADRPTDRLFVVSATRAANLESADAKLSELPVGPSAGAKTETGDAAGEGKGSVGFFGTVAEGQSFVFIIDYSGSMNGYRFIRARSELIQALDDLTPKQKFFVIFYNQDAQPMYLPGRRQKLVPASRTVLRRARRWINQQRAGGGTVPDMALKMALDMQPDVIFFLSDGEFVRTARTIAREFNEHGTIIHTIAFQDEMGKLLLKGIAEDNHGRYRFVE